MDAVVAAGVDAAGLVGNVLTVVVGLVLKLKPFDISSVLMKLTGAMSCFAFPL
jgi:hypothetical protein